MKGGATMRKLSKSLRAVVYYLDFIVAPVATVVIFVLTWQRDLESVQAAFWFSSFILGTLIETLIHRMIHSVKIFGHAAHHAKPLAYQGPSIPFTGAIFGGLFFGLRALMGEALAGPITSGLVGWYSFYLVVHFACHRFPELEPGSYLARKAQYHDRHHRGVMGTFGVTTSFWDHAWQAFKKRRQYRAR